MRRIALELMATLEDFQPRLIGSVASGAIHAHSDIDLQLFTHRDDLLEEVLEEADLDAEREDKHLSGPDGPQHFLHFHLEVEDIPVELSVYPPWALQVPSICSITGRPIDRMPIGRVSSLYRSPR